MNRQAAVAYVRSTDQDRPSLAEATYAQRVAIQTWAERERVAITTWQVDLGVHADTPIAERPGLVAAYRSLREHRAGILVASTPDRFAHDELVAALIERAALAEGAMLRTVDKAAPSESEPAPEVGYARGAIDLARAFRRVTVAARVRDALAEKRARGERIGTVPYGYRLASDGVHIEEDAREQGVITTVKSLAKAGISQRKIVAQLSESGVVGRTGAPLRQTQIAKILRP
jgi:DNA invertase Pin-like site-specific DNA recombinase